MVLVPLLFVAIPVAANDVHAFVDHGTSSVAKGCGQRLKHFWDGNAWQCGGISYCKQQCDPPSKIAAQVQKIEKEKRILEKEIRDHFEKKKTLGEALQDRVGCDDSDDDCAILKSSCNSNEWVSQNCRMTCGKCSSGANQGGHGQEHQGGYGTPSSPGGGGTPSMPSSPHGGGTPSSPGGGGTPPMPSLPGGGHGSPGGHGFGQEPTEEEK